jgi:hypothetical protein
MKQTENSTKHFTTGLKPLVLAGLFLLLFMQVSAQSGTPDFSGTWGFNESKSTLGDGGPRMAATLLVIAQKGNDMTIDRTQASFEGDEMKMNEKYTLDGKECSNTGMMNSVRKSAVNWSPDKKSLINVTNITFERDGEKMEMKSTEVWKMSDDNKTLTIESNFSSQWGDMKTTLVYDKK